MKIIPILKCISYFPYLMIKGRQGKEKSIEENYQIVHTYSNKILKRMGYHLSIHGIENINERGMYFVCNHQGTLDPVLICAASPTPISFISKKENENIPILGLWATNIGTIHFDRKTKEGNIHMLRQAMRYLKDKKNVLIFPEGTRSKSNQMNPFKDKAFQPAIMAKAKIVPVCIQGAYCLDENYDSKELEIYFDKPISYEQYKDMTREELSDFVKRQIQSH